MKSIKQAYLIKASLEKVWQALIDPQIIDDFGAGPAKMSSEEGFEFELWGGDIFGKNLQVLPLEKLVQDWTAGSWDEPSKVSFTLYKNGNHTKLVLFHENIPDSEFEEIKDGWKRYYLGPMKEYLEMTS